jgi:Zn-dependent alcohol dehydrogenase
MSTAAQAVVFAQAGKLDFRAVTLREPADDEVVVDISYSSMAGCRRYRTCATP